MSKSSLTDFAKANPQRRTGKCWACSIPETKEINAGRHQGLSDWTIRQWLIRDMGYMPEEIGPGKLRHHFGSGHHLRAK